MRERNSAKESSPNNVGPKSTTDEDLVTSSDSNTDNIDDDDSDDEDLGVVEARMKDQLSQMEQSYRKFHQFLQENEKSLLEFGKDEGADIDDEADDVDEDEVLDGDNNQTETT
jgi:hypothetical protein